MVIDQLTHDGVMDPGLLYELPFTAIHHEGVEGAFAHADADVIFRIVAEINERAAA